MKNLIYKLPIIGFYAAALAATIFVVGCGALRPFKNTVGCDYCHGFKELQPPPSVVKIAGKSYVKKEWRCDNCMTRTYTLSPLGD